MGAQAALLIFLVALVSAQGVDVRTNVVRKLKFLPPSPAVVAAAKRHQIPITGLDTPSGTNELQPGDTATVLVTFFQKKKQTQWLLHLEAAALDPAKATNKPVTFSVGSAFGPPMKFRSRPYPVRLRMAGPFATTGPVQQSKAELKVEQFSVNQDFLALGLDDAAAVLHRWSKITNFSGRVTSKAMVALKPNLEEQRALSATFPALISYFEIIQHTKGLEELLRKLVELPSLWSIVKHRGIHLNLTFHDKVLPWPAVAEDWNLEPAARAHHFPWLMQLNGEPSLKITLVTASPRPPLLICGGVVGVLAEKIGDEETYMTLRLLSVGRKKGQ